MSFKKALVGIALSCSTLTYAAAPHSQDRLIVKLKENQNISQFGNISKSKNLFENVYVVYSQNIEGLYSTLIHSGKVEYVEKDFYGTKNKLAKSVPTPQTKSEERNKFFNDPKVNKVWAFNSARKHGISVTDAYSSRQQNERNEIIVAVVDTGVDFNHEDLKDNMWINTGEIAGNGIDDDGNGYIDDIHGINTLVRDEDGNATSDMMDKHGHGTHVSGTIAAVQNNGKGIAGIAKNAKIMGLRTVPNNGDELDVDVIEAFIYAAKNGAKIINCSFGKSHNEGGNAVKDAIEFIGREYGVLVVAAAGNDTKNIDTRKTYPASFDNENLLVVASSTKRGRMSYFSNYGEVNVDLAAPGSSVYSLAFYNGYQSMSGTSMASPTAAGAAAEVLSQNPSLSPEELKRVLMDTVTPVRKFKGKMVTGGRVDLNKALEAL